MAVTDLDGVEWRVWRRWYTWRRWVTLRDVFNSPTVHTDRYGGSDIDAILDIPFMLLALVGLVASLLDLAVQLVVLPFVLLARVVRLAPWPVQIDKAEKHVRTLWVRGFVAAGRLRDEQVASIRAGTIEGADRAA